jgi:uncharacterized protein YjgD (DUF1641 family)
MTTIRLTMLDNAQDSLERTIEIMAWKDIAQDTPRLKQAILSVAHAVELILKERLSKTNPALIWEDIDKYPSIEARTVTVERAVNRLRKIAGIPISADDERLIRSLRNTRNAIEHFEWQTTHAEARLIVGGALSFCLAFAHEHLGRDLAYAFKRDDTWHQLIIELTEFSKSHGSRLKQKMESRGQLPSYCSFCNNETVPFDGGACELCGHWPDSAEDDIPF